MAQYRYAKKPSVGTIILRIALIVLAVAVVAGGAYAVYHFAFADKNVEEPTVVETAPPTVATFDEAPTQAPTEDPDVKYNTLAQEYVKDMTLDEKIYQMLIVSPESLTGVDVATVAGDATKTALESSPVGGIIYDADNFEDADQTKEMISKSQSYAKTAMFIAVSQEGGDNSPVSEKLDTTKLESMSTYEKDGEQKAFDNAQTIANDLKGFGFNLNLAPVANLSGDNALSTDAETASKLIAKSVEGYRANGVVSTLKSFPDVADTEKTLDQLKSSEFMPFVSGFEADADVVMLSGTKATALDDAPAFMSEQVITEVLIKELNFNGVVMTPDLSDTAIADTYSVDEIATSTIKAGANILFNPADIDAYVSAIKGAVESGTLTQEQIDQSVTKIIALKYKYGILIAPQVPAETQITDESISVTSNVPI